MNADDSVATYQRVRLMLGNLFIGTQIPPKMVLPLVLIHYSALSPGVIDTCCNQWEQYILGSV